MAVVFGAGSMASTLELFRGLAIEQSAAIGPGLIPAVERVGAWTAMHAFEPEANSLYEHVSFKVLETALRVAPRSFADLMRLFESLPPLGELVKCARQGGFLESLEVPRVSEASSSSAVLERFLDGVARCRDRLGFVPVGEGLHALGPEYLRESLREAEADSIRGRAVKRALRSAALRPFSLLTIDRLLHLLQGADYLFKLDEFTFLPWDSFVLPRGAAFVTGGDLEQSMAALKEPAAEASEMELELGRRLARRAVVFRHLDPKRMQERATERMGFAVRTDNIRALRCKSLRAGEPDEVLLLEGEADEADGFHEFVHHIQEERHGPSWIAENLMAAEMEAHARELNLRRRFGNSRLYDDIARLSPFGFEMGLRLYVEQVYFRLAEMPGIVS